MSIIPCKRAFFVVFQRLNGIVNGLLFLNYFQLEKRRSFVTFDDFFNVRCFTFKDLIGFFVLFHALIIAGKRAFLLTLFSYMIMCVYINKMLITNTMEYKDIVQSKIKERLEDYYQATGYCRDCDNYKEVIDTTNKTGEHVQTFGECAC